MKTALLLGAALLSAVSIVGWALAQAPPQDRGAAPPLRRRMPPKTKLMRVAAGHPRDLTIDWRIAEPAEVLRRVDRSLGELEKLVHQAGAEECDALAFSEDTLGLLKW